MLVLNVLVATGGIVINYLMLRPHLAPAAALEAAAAEAKELREYDFFPIEKIIVSLREKGREHYFVLDLILLAEASDRPRRFERIEPIVRNSVVSYLSGFDFEELRALSVSELQARLEQTLFADFANKNAEAPFEQVLVSKLIVQ